MNSITWQMAGLGALALGLIAAAIWIGYNKRNSPERREQRRRLYVNQQGRLGEALIIDVIGETLVFQYQVSGVAYSGSQDVSTLKPFLPGALERLVGHVAIKYILKNPANSIVVCEAWSGLRALKGEHASATVEKRNT